MMSESDDHDLALILAYLEDRATEVEQAEVPRRLKQDRAFAKRLAVQARLAAGLETMARVQAHAPEALAEALKAGAIVEAAPSAGVVGTESSRKGGPGKAPDAAQRVVQLKKAQATRQRAVAILVAAVLLIALAAGWYIVSQQKLIETPIAQQEPLHNSLPAADEVGRIEFVPSGLAAKDLPVLIHGQGAEATSQIVTAGMPIHAGDRLVTLGQAENGGIVGPKVQVGVRLRLGAMLDLSENTELVFPISNDRPNFFFAPISLQRGRMYVAAATKTHMDIGNTAGPTTPIRFTIKTSSANFSTDEASAEIICSDQESIARVKSGWLEVANSLGVQMVQTLEECVVAVSQAPAAPVAVFASSIWSGRAGRAGPPPGPNAALAGVLTLERPTLVCLGATWIIKGDQNHNGVVYCNYREAAQPTGAWRRSLNFWPIDTGGWPAEQPRLPANETMFAGSLFDLKEDTAYELQFHLEDPDGQNAVRTLMGRTRAEPQALAGGRTLEVIPDPGNTGGGTGTAADPFRGLAAADQAAQPGDSFLLRPGNYTGSVALTHSGAPGRPIVYRGSDAATVILDGQGSAEQWPDRLLSANDLHDVILDRLTFKRAEYLIVAHGSQRIAVTQCILTACNTALTAERINSQNAAGVADFFIADNAFRGPATWPEEVKGNEASRAIYLGGQGHVVCRNRLTNWGDGIDTAPTAHTGSVDVYQNDLSHMTDDAIELDFSNRNVRCFRNRISNVFQGISAQPVLGGPAYIFRNTLCNVELESIKLHSSPNGVLVFHNTGVKTGAALEIHTAAPSYHCLFRNNLWIGTEGPYGLFLDTTLLHCDFDYDGVGGSFEKFLLWNRTAVATVAEARAGSGPEQHGVAIQAEGCFASGLVAPQGPPVAIDGSAQDLRLSATSEAIDKGAVMPGVNDTYLGQAPDLGAFERGDGLPVYGPRPEK